MKKRLWHRTRWTHLAGLDLPNSSGDASPSEVQEKDESFDQDFVEKGQQDNPLENRKKKRIVVKEDDLEAVDVENRELRDVIAGLQKELFEKKEVALAELSEKVAEMRLNIEKASRDSQKLKAELATREVYWEMERRGWEKNDDILVRHAQKLEDQLKARDGEKVRIMESELRSYICRMKELKKDIKSWKKEVEELRMAESEIVQKLRRELELAYVKMSRIRAGMSSGGSSSSSCVDTDSNSEGSSGECSERLYSHG